jgi:hypothetical protein
VPLAQSVVATRSLSDCTPQKQPSSTREEEEEEVWQAWTRQQEAWQPVLVLLRVEGEGEEEEEEEDAWLAVAVVGLEQLHTNWATHCSRVAATYL